MAKKNATKEKKAAPAQEATPESMRLSVDQLFSKFEEEKARLQALESRRGMFEQLIAEADAAKIALDELKKAKKGESLLIPIGNGYYVDATLEKAGAVKSMMAGSIVVEKGVGNAQKELDARLEELRSALENIRKDERLTVKNLQSMEAVIRQVGAKQQAAQAQAKAN